MTGLLILYTIIVIICFVVEEFELAMVGAIFILPLVYLVELSDKFKKK